jgi:hypothetical protein
MPERCTTLSTTIESWQNISGCGVETHQIPACAPTRAARMFLTQRKFEKRGKLIRSVKGGARGGLPSASVRQAKDKPKTSRLIEVSKPLYWSACIIFTGRDRTTNTKGKGFLILWVSRDGHSHVNDSVIF